ncbi:MAG: hypothetical protein WC998_05620 [Candidatus Paceibacterota bacterium]|jgi:hypothetical protein
MNCEICGNPATHGIGNALFAERHFCADHNEKDNSQSATVASYMASGNFNPAEIKRQIEGGDNMRDISECHQSEIGEIIWLHKSGNESIYIAKKLRVKLFQVNQLIQDAARLSESI